MPIGTAVALGAGGLASLIGGIVNAAANMSAADRAAALQDQNLQNWLKINIPDPNDQKIALQKFVSQGQLDPKLESAIKQNPSEFSKVTEDAGYKVAQNRALQQLQDIGNQGGMTLADKSNLQDIQLQQGARDKANRESIAAQMARQGAGGSGFELQAQLAGQQQAADQAAKSGLSVAAQAQDRALQSIMQGGQLAGQYSNQDLQQKDQAAQAQDAINRFNTTNLQSIGQRNVASQNEAQRYDLQNAQDIANKNTTTANQEEQYNKGLAQQRFDNQTKMAAGMSGTYGALAGIEQQKGQAIGNAATNIAQGISGVGTSLGNQGVWQNYLDASKNNSNLKLPKGY